MRLILDVEGNKKVTVAFGQKEEQISVRYLFAPEKARANRSRAKSALSRAHFWRPKTHKCLDLIELKW